MNIISYDIGLKRNENTKEEILRAINSCIAENYANGLEDRKAIEGTWEKLPYKQFKSIHHSEHLLFTFETETVQVFLFKKQINDVVSMDDLSITVFATSKEKEINLILKSSFSKLKQIFSKKLNVSIIEGTQVSLYPFDFNNDDILNPNFCVKAAYDNRTIKLETSDWIKLVLFIIFTSVFVILYFVTPSDITDPATQVKTENNIKEIYSALMGFGLGLLINEVITKFIIPYFSAKHPTVLITNFSNIFENRGRPPIEKQEEQERPKDPEI